MLSNRIEYVALVSSDQQQTAGVLEKHFGLPRQELASTEGPVPLFRLGRSALAVFPIGHSLVEGETKTGVHHIALGVDNLPAAAKRAAGEGFAAIREKGLAGRACSRLPRESSVGVRVVLTEPLELAPHDGKVVAKIDHLGVASADVMEDERVFCGKFGFAIESRQTDMEVRMPVESFTSDKYGVVYHNRAPEPVGGLRVYFITVGDCEIEFLANFDPRQGAQIEHGQAGSTKQDQGAITRFVQSRGRGLHHVALRARDIDNTLAGMAEAGLPMIDTKGRPGSRRAMIGFPHPKATGGILMHLVQRDG